eukprot:249534-Hanusia_phi.AAC.1
MVSAIRSARYRRGGAAGKPGLNSSVNLPESAEYRSTVTVPYGTARRRAARRPATARRPKAASGAPRGGGGRRCALFND